MKLRYFGHSAFELVLDGTNLLFDPFITGNPRADGVVAAAELHPDVILLTHAHGDHWGDTPSIAKRTGATVVANHEITQYLGSRHGHDKVQPMNTGGSWTFDWGEIRYTDARHSSSFPDGTYGGNPNGILLFAEGKTVYNAGDTAPFAEMQFLGEDYEIDLAVLPIGDCYTMCPKTSIRAIRLLRPKRVLPVHYNTFPLIEVEEDELRRWEDRVRDAGAEPVVLQPGGELEL